MLVDPFSQPERTIYVVGARVLRLVREKAGSKHDPDSLLRRINAGRDRETRLSWAQFHLGLDWLYMLGLIQLTDSGDIEYVA